MDNLYTYSQIYPHKKTLNKEKAEEIEQYYKQCEEERNIENIEYQRSRI